MRHHYITICTRGKDIEVTHIDRGSYIEISFEQATNGGFNTLLMDNNGKILSCNGFNASDVQFLTAFLVRNVSVIIDESRGNL